ncbi:MAG: hypothetical protein CO189_00330 [candidate division Zixibacteria bacterium CG_4_9_14_3_um_filter_46_8]|nr:MAG: hypothetical protein CO189_00330 [candidate division Zixibacteria bacterium CG_4_9_14_3_um_filter_46_8]
MKRKLTITTFIALMIMTVSAYSAETSLKGTIFANWMMDLSEGADNYNAFMIERAYLGAESKLSDYTSARITFDIRPERFSTSSAKVVDSGGDTLTIPSMSAYSGYPVVLKYAYVDWKVKPVAQYLKIRLGLQPTAYLDYMSNIWMRRYLAKNITDENGWTSTSDLGVSFIGALGQQGKLGEVGLSVLNGTKYSDFVDKNKNKDFNLFARIVPLYNNEDLDQTALFAQIYTGTQNKTIVAPDEASDWKRTITSFGGKLAYQKIVDFCFDMNFHTLGQGSGNDDLKQRGLSFWGGLYLNALAPSSSLFKTLILFGRADTYDPNTDADDDGNSMILAGVECAPIKGVRAAIGYKNTSYQASGVDPLKSMFINTEIKF